MAVGSVGGTYGLSGSGMDIDTIVKSLMTAQQAKADALLQKKTVAEWQKTAYNTLYDDISKFRDMAFNYTLEGTLSSNKVSSSDPSVAAVTALADAADVNHSLVVGQLAQGVNLTSASKVTTGTVPYTNIAEQFTKDGLVPTGEYKFTISNGDVTSEDIIIEPEDSINDIVSKINNAPGLNVKASYDSTLDRFFISTTNTGSSAGIKIAKTSSTDTNWGTDFFVDKLKLPTTNVEPNGIIGVNAQFKLDDVVLSQESNTFSISGVTYSLTGATPSAVFTDNVDPAPDTITGGVPTNISVTNDTDKAVANIQSLVDSYNKILEEVNGKLNETRYKDFAPLTDAQKKDMNESDITAWELKSKSGMLHNDPTLTSLVNTMRNAFSGAVSGSTSIYNSASSIGITTGRNYLEGGKLTLDTDKLRKALNAEPDVLNRLFGVVEQDGTDIDFGTQGIAGRLHDGIKTKLDQLERIAGKTGTSQSDTDSSYAKRLKTYKLQISNQADRFEVVQAAYYKKFNAMEVALQKLYSQSSWLDSFGTSS